MHTCSLSLQFWGFTVASGLIMRTRCSCRKSIYLTTATVLVSVVLEELCKTHRCCCCCCCCWARRLSCHSTGRRSSLAVPASAAVFGRPSLNVGGLPFAREVRGCGVAGRITTRLDNGPTSPWRSSTVRDPAPSAAVEGRLPTRGCWRRDDEGVGWRRR